jgi:hypothetical protein
MSQDSLKSFRREFNRLIALNRRSLALAEARHGGKTWTNTARARDEQWQRCREKAAELFNLHE